MSRLHSVGRGRRVARLNVSLGSFALPFALLLCLATSSLKGAQALKYIGKYDDNASSRGVRGRYGRQHTKGGRYLSAGRRVGGVSIGRRLLDAVSDGVDTNATTAAEPPELEPSASGAKVVTDANKASCVTALDIIETHPNLTILRDVIADLPTIRAALSDPTAADTLFAPVDDAVEGYRRWAGYDETDEGRKAGLISLLGRDDEPEVENWREFLVAYHAVPDKALELDDLCELEGDDDVLEDAAEAMMPLMVIHPDIMDYRPCSAAIAGMGSIATILGSQMVGRGRSPVTFACAKQHS